MSTVLDSEQSHQHRTGIRRNWFGKGQAFGSILAGGAAVVWVACQGLLAHCMGRHMLEELVWEFV